MVYQSTKYFSSRWVFFFLLLFYSSVLLHIRGPLSGIRGITALLRRRWRKFRRINIKYLLRMDFYIFYPEFNSRLWREPWVNVHHVITRAIVQNNYIYCQWSQKMYCLNLALMYCLSFVLIFLHHLFIFN